MISISHASIDGANLHIIVDDAFARFASCRLSCSKIHVTPGKRTIPLFTDCIFLDCTFEPSAEELFRLGYMNGCNIQNPGGKFEEIGNS